MKIAVIGAGAIGGICAALIRRAGHEVQVVTRREEHARAIRDQGIRVTGIRGAFTVKMDAVHAVGDMTPDPDLVLLGVKATAMTAAARELAGVLGPAARVVSLQNGFCEERLAQILGRERVIGCVTGWGATRHSDLDLEMTSAGDFIIGHISPVTAGPGTGLARVKAVLDHVLETRISENITGHLYAKLIINACITSVGAVCGLYLGQMLIKRQVRRMFIAIMAEAMAVAQAMDIQVAVFAGKLDYYQYLEPRGFLADLKRHAFLMALGFKFRRLKSSSLQSLLRGQKTEIEFLTGVITQNGQRLGVATPVNDQVFSLVRDIEAGRLAVSAANLDRITL